MKKIYLLLFLCVASVSCNEWFDTTPDGTSIPEDRFFRNENAFLNALTDVYTQLRSESLYGRMLSVGELEFMGQNFQPAGTDFQAAADLNYADAAFRTAIEQTFVDMYKAIAACNNVIGHIETTKIVFNSKSRKRIITGELYGLRAALHFELLRLFHPAYAVDPGFVGLSYMVRFGMTASEPLSTEAFVGKVIADLERAASELETTDPVLDGFKPGTVLPGEIDSRLRTFCMNYYAVTTLLARVCLYKGDYEQAAAYAARAFEHQTKVEKRYRLFYYFGPGEYGDDYSFSREHLFGIATLPEGFPRSAALLYGRDGASVTKHYAALFDNPKDTRYRDWFDNSDPSRVFMAYKFGENSVLNGYTSVAGNESVLPCRIPFVKLGEAALIEAEALVRQSADNIADAAARVAELQKARDIPTVAERLETSGLTVGELLDAIELEYRREFFGEGQLFYYYKRLNSPRIPRSDGTELTMTADKYTWPIPEGSVNVKQAL